jgi:hypothetical protein
MDCCVNVNVLAFLAQTGLTDAPGYSQACEMVLEGIRWSARRWDYLDRLSPYYPKGLDLSMALKNALRRGATALRVGLAELELFTPPCRDYPPSAILFSVADRSTLWSSRALWAARQLANLWSVHDPLGSP